MQKHIKNLLKDNILFIAIVITIAITYLSLIDVEEGPVSLIHFDKIQHLIAYFFLTLSWLLVLKRKPKETKLTYVVVLACVFFGIIIEVLQATITNYREASFLDMLANSLGAIIAMLVFSVKLKKNKLFNT